MTKRINVLGVLVDGNAYGANSVVTPAPDSVPATVVLFADSVPDTVALFTDRVDDAVTIGWNVVTAVAVVR